MPNLHLWGCIPFHPLALPQLPGPPTPDVCPTSLPTPCTAGVLTCPLGVLVVGLRLNVRHQLLLLMAHIHPAVSHDLLLDARTKRQKQNIAQVQFKVGTGVDTNYSTKGRILESRLSRLHFLTNYGVTRQHTAAPLQTSRLPRLVGLRIRNFFSKFSQSVDM